MPRYVVDKTRDYQTIYKRGVPKHVLKIDTLRKFDTSLLGLGSIGQDASAIDGLAAVFDLQGFTQFCGQIEPQYSVPKFLDRFLGWLVGELRKETIRKQHPEGAELWHPLPFFLKFLGDGLLVVWETNAVSSIKLRNLLVSLSNICEDYSSEFLPTVKTLVAGAPPRLRCGVARGTVLSIGNGNDFVGSCINIAARIQKLPGITFGFNRRGIDLDGEDLAVLFGDAMLIRKVEIRGISDCELICIRKTEFEAMPKTIADLYKTP